MRESYIVQRRLGFADKTPETKLREEAADTTEEDSGNSATSSSSDDDPCEAIPPYEL